ncbi:hypothetical protein O181_025265 [Austropuccinia psidii MF-1]|uniref:Uncharacterized protein n=1 Tax=Austropuccinia psidii MF-1 TaxID=1389203 RepID=A0A9Q3CMA7_9BASI|nr:hypothetical protein [Austropuccinia psidii MF-1]
MGASQGTGGPTLAQYDQPVSHQSEPSLLKIMQLMTQIMANFRAASSSESLRPTAFKTASMMGLNPSNSEASFSIFNCVAIMIHKILLNIEIKFSIPPHSHWQG